MPVEEILVHIAGPCTKQDDERFRRLAHAYNAFEAAETFHISALTMIQHEHGQSNGTDVRLQAARNDPSTANEPLLDMPRTSSTTSDRPITMVPQTTLGKRPPIFNQSNDTANKKLKRPLPPNFSKVSPQYIGDTPLSIAALESQLFTSSLAMQQELEQNAHEQGQTSSPSPRRPHPSSQDEVTPKSSPPMVLPPTSSKSEPHANQQNEQSTVAAEPCPGADTASPVSSAPLPDNQAPTSSRPMPEEGPRSSPGPSQNSSPVPTPPPIERSSPVLLPQWLISSDPPSPVHPLDQGLRVESPSPIVSSADYDTYSHVTPLLAHLCTVLSPAEYWRPVRVRRMPGEVSRGEWRFCVDDWDQELLHECWNYLANFVRGDGKEGSGHAGWSIFLALEKATEADLSLNEGMVDGAGRRRVEEGTSTVMRFRCWGEIGVHVWLLLYAASQSKVKNAGAQWITLGPYDEGSKEIVDVQMPWS